MTKMPGKNVTKSQKTKLESGAIAMSGLDHVRPHRQTYRPSEI